NVTGVQTCALPIYHAAREVETPFPHLSIPRTGRRTNEDLPDRRLARCRERAEDGVIDGHDPPTEYRHAESDENGLNQVDGGITGTSGRRQEKHAERHALHRPDAEQAVGDLGPDAGAVAGPVVRGSAAVGEPGDGGESHRRDGVGGIAVGARDEADAAGVTLAPGIEQTKSPLC